MAVVKQQYVAAAQSARQPLKYDTGIGIDRIESAARPGCEPQSHSRQHRLEKGAAQTRGRAKESRALTGYRLDSGLRTLDFGRNCSRAEYGKPVQMMLTVILDRMAAADNLARQLRVPLDALANAEKRGLGTMLIQQVEHPRGDLWIRSIVNRDRNSPGGRRGTWQVRPVGSQQLASRPETCGHEQQVIRHDGAQHPRPQVRARNQHNCSRCMQRQRGLDSQRRFPAITCWRLRHWTAGSCPGG